MKKLVNKTTGQVGVLGIHNEEFWVDVSGTSANSYSLPEPGSIIRYSSLPELAAEWEDYEDPDKYFWIDVDGYVTSNDTSFKDVAFETFRQNLKSIGNYFVSKEEAEKAVEKLKAWKRLKDKGFRFSGWTIDDGLGISICTNTDEDDIYDEDKRRIKPDLDLLFGGEE